MTEYYVVFIPMEGLGAQQVYRTEFPVWVSHDDVTDLIDGLPVVVRMPDQADAEGVNRLFNSLGTMLSDGDCQIGVLLMSNDDTTRGFYDPKSGQSTVENGGVRSYGGR